jgi:hypothetical protein
LGALSLGKILGAVYALLGLIFKAFFALFSVLGSLLGIAVGGSDTQGSEALVGLLFGAGSIIFLPIFYGILGFIGGLIPAWIYTLMAGFGGGLKIELEDRSRVY